MNTTGLIVCPCCGDRLVVSYDEISGFSINKLYLSQKLEEKVNAAKQNAMILKLQAEQQKRMGYLLNNLTQCCCDIKGDKNDY